MPEIAELLFSDGTLFDLYIGRWAGIKKLKPNDVLLEDIDKDAIYLGHKKLLPKTAVEEIQKLEGQARRALEMRSLDFPISGARFVSHAALPDLVRDLGRIRTSYNQEVDILIANYEGLKTDQLARLNKQSEDLITRTLNSTQSGMVNQKREELEKWRQAQAKTNAELYPPVNTLKSRFSFEWRLFRVAEFNAAEVLSSDMLAEVQDKMRSDLEAWASEAASEMHKTLGAAASQAHKMLQENGKLNPKNLRPLFNAFESFKAVDFTGASPFRASLDKIKEKFLRDGENGMELTAEAINGTVDSKGEFANLLADLGRLAVEDVAEEAGTQSLVRSGRYGRVLSL